MEQDLSPRVSFVNASGEVFLSSARKVKDEKVKVNIADRAYFQQQKAAQEDRLDVGVPVQSHATGKWVVPQVACVPIALSNTSLEGWSYSRAMRASTRNWRLASSP